MSSFMFVLLIPQAIAPVYNRVIVVMISAVVFETCIRKCSTHVCFSDISHCSVPPKCIITIRYKAVKDELI